MKRNRLLSFLWTWIISLAMAQGIAGSLATAFDFGFPFRLWATLAVGSGAVAALCAIPFGFLTGAITVGAASYGLWRWGDLSGQLSTLVEEITGCFRKGYGWPVLSWTEPLSADSVVLPFLLIGLFIALVTARVVARRGRTFWTILAAAPFVSLCIVLNDTVPASIHIASVLFALTMLLLTQTLRRRDEQQANRLAAMAALPVIAALVILFAAVPREGYIPAEEDLAMKTVTWFQELEPGQKVIDRVMSFISGIGKEKLSLKNTGPRGEQKYKVMEITAETDGTLYLRGRAYDVYDGRNWLASGGEWALDGDYTTRSTFQGDVAVRTQIVHDVLYSPVVSTESIRDQFHGGYIANPDKLKEYTYPWFIQSDGQFFTQTSYLLSSDGTGDTDIRSGAEPLMQELAGQYLELPEDTREAAERYLREQMPKVIKKSSPQPRDILVSTHIAGEKHSLPINAAGDVMLEAAIIRELVLNSAAYDLQTPKMPAGEDDFAMWFLRSSDTGYCVHFATAATVLLRATGIPARYVEGYTISAWENKTVAVLGEDAHAWVEYWVPGYGWMLLEATPGYGSTSQHPTEPEETTPATTLPDETEPETSTQPDISAVPDQPDRPTRPQDDPTEPTSGSIPLLPGGNKEGPTLDLTPLIPVFKWLAILLLAAAAIIGQWKLRLKARQKKLSRGSPNRQALLHWRELTQMWQLLKEPPSEELEKLALKAKFSQYTLTAEELESFRQARAEAVERMAASGRRRQLLYRLILALY